MDDSAAAVPSAARAKADPSVESVTLMSGSLARTPFRLQVPAIAVAGFQALTCLPNVWRHAERKDGLSLEAMRALLEDHGVGITAVEAVSDWAAPAADAAAGRLPSNAPRSEAFAVAAALGASTLATSHTVGGHLELDRDLEAFAGLCDDAAERGLRVALEFIPFSGVPDLATALTIVEQAGRPNAGLVVDVWHLARSGGVPDDLRGIPPGSVFMVQLADGPREAPADLIEEASLGRWLPGPGELPVVECLAVLAERGVQAPVGPEVHRREWQERPLNEVASELFASTADVRGRAERQVPT